MEATVGWLEGLRALFRARRWSPERLEDYRDRQVRRLVRHAWKNVPHYRDAFGRAGLTPADIRGVHDLRKLPPLTKQQLRSTPPERMTARGVVAKDLVEHRTNGSTGEPITVRRTWFEERLLAAFRRRAYREFGVRRRDRLAQVMFRDHLHQNDHQALLDLVRRAGWFRTRSIFCLQEPEQIARELAEYRPNVVHGFPTILAQVADAMENRAIGPDTVSLAVLGGEVITRQARESIRRGMGAVTREVYGCSEVNLIAWERPDGRLRVVDDAVVVEVEVDGRPARPGETGEVLVTSLIAFAMPILRLRIGDLATVGAMDDTEWPFSSLSAIRGRVVETFRLPDGRELHPWRITVPILMEDAWVARYQLTQERADRVRLSIIPGRHPSAEELARQAQRIRSELGPELELEVDLVDSLPVEANGKFQMTRTLLKGPDSQESETSAGILP